MKKSIAILCASLATVNLCALPLGNPAEASLLTEGIFPEGSCWHLCDCVSMRLGFYGYYVFDHSLEVEENGFDAGVHRNEIYTNAGYIALNLCDRLDLFTTLGTTKIRLTPYGSTFDLASDLEYVIETDDYFSWSVGSHLTLLRCGCFILGGEGQYFASCAPINFVQRSRRSPIYLDGVLMKYQEWQVGLGLSYAYAIPCCCTSFVPYIGVRWGGTSIDMEDTSVDGGILRDLENTRNWGYAVGLSLVQNCSWSLSAEGRFADERALYINGQVRF